MKLPNTVPIPAPEPTILTMPVPTPMNLAAGSVSLEMVPFWKLLLGISGVGGGGSARLLRHSSVSVGPFSTTAESGSLSSCWEVIPTSERMETNMVWAYILVFRVWVMILVMSSEFRLYDPLGIEERYEFKRHSEDLMIRFKKPRWSLPRGDA